jgi:hypothetical protein
MEIPMTETTAAYGRAVPPAAARQIHRAAAMERIATAAAGLTDLPDVFLVIIERALARDMSGIHEFAHQPGYLFAPAPARFPPTPPRSSSHVD